MTRLILIFLILFPLHSHSQHAPRITELVFYGFENPRLNIEAPYVSNDSYNKRGAEFLQEYFFSFGDQITVSKQLLKNEKAKYHLIVRYKKAAEQLFILHELDSTYVMEKDQTYFLIDREKNKDWELILYEFKWEMFFVHDIFINGKQVIASIADSSAYLSFYEESADQLKLPDEYQSWSKKKIANYASSLIYAHLAYLQYFYNFPVIRARILNSLEQLAINLYERGMPSKLIHGGSMCVYKPLHKLYSVDHHWHYYVSSWTFPSDLKSSFQYFNQVLKIEEKR